MLSLAIRGRLRANDDPGQTPTAVTISLSTNPKRSPVERQSDCRANLTTARQQNPKQTIRGAEPWASGPSAAQHRDLMAQGEDGAR
jgi:hypothetical protein